MLKRFLWPTLVVVFLWMAISIPTTAYLFWLEESTEKIRNASEPSVRAASQMQQVVWKIQSAAVQQYQSASQSSENSLSHLEMDFQKCLSEAVSASVYPEEPAILADIERHWKSFDEVARQFWSNRNADSIDVDRLIELDLLAQVIMADCNQLAQVNNRYLDEAFERRQKLERRISIFRGAYLFIGPLIGVYLGLKMARRLQQTISKINVILTGTADNLDKYLGSVDVAVSGSSDDLQVTNQQVEIVSTRIRDVIAELQLARKRVLDSERLAAVGALAAGVAHEIRNPLTSIRLLMQTASRNSDNIVLEIRSLEIILSEISRMEETIRRLLEFAKPQQLNRMQFDFRECIHGAVALVNGRARQRRVAINVAIPSHAIYVDGDQKLLHQMLVNLLINAIDFSSNNDSVEIQLAIQPGNAKLAQITVADHGPGIPEADLERIFEPFVTNRADGIGLGLSLCKEILQRHQGSISVLNRTGGGTEFVVQLPVVDSLAASTLGNSALPTTRQNQIGAVSKP